MIRDDDHVNKNLFIYKDYLIIYNILALKNKKHDQLDTYIKLNQQQQQGRILSIFLSICQEICRFQTTNKQQKSFIIILQCN